MKILIFEWGGGSYTYRDIVNELCRRGVSYRTISYTFRNKNEDEFFVSRFGRILDEERFDAVFSVNYFPLVSECANARGVRYIAWCYDNPMDVPDIERTLGNEVNSVYMFDRLQVEGYQKKGFTNVKHLPLAVDVSRLSAIPFDPEYRSQISFVGTFYDSAIDIYRAGMNDLCREYVDTVCNAQRGVYGKYIIDEYMADEVISEINAAFAASDNPAVRSMSVSLERMKFVMAADVTRFERILLLEMLGRRYDVQVYSREQPEAATHIRLMGTCNYYDEMPKVFKGSDINMNITLKCIQSGIPQRALDIMGAGGFLLTNYQPELEEHFEDGKSLAVFNSFEEAVDKADYYMKHEAERERIADAGRMIVEKHYSYSQAMGVLLDGGADDCR